MPGAPAASRTFVALLHAESSDAVQQWERHRGAMEAAAVRRDTLLSQAIGGYGGRKVPAAFGVTVAVFPSVSAAVAAAVDALRALAAESAGETGSSLPSIAVVGGVFDRASADPDNVPMRLRQTAALLAAAGHAGRILLGGEVAELGADVLPTDSSLRDLGERRLPDLAAPLRVAQVVAPGLPARFPPLASADRRVCDLPVPPATLVGRDEEVARAEGLLRSTETRLLTLIGPAGVGKTRLAIEVAWGLLDERADGVRFVELAPLVDVDLVDSALAAALEVREEPGRRVRDAVKSDLAGRQVLLVLDTVEHLLPAAAPVVADLLEAGAGVQVLATSREGLHLRGERLFPVSPLEVPEPDRPPSPEELIRYGAVRLFVERAQATQAGFTLTGENAAAVAGICARLDGLPLALELAAARVRVLSPRAILNRLGERLTLLTSGAADLPDRQRTLRAAIAWSHDLLGAEEQALFRRLSVFAGSFSPEAAAAVIHALDGAPLDPNCAGDGPAGLDLLERLDALAEKSLLVPVIGQDEEPRFSLLDCVREFGLERLATSGEEHAVRGAHARRLLALAAPPAEAEADQQGSARRLDRIDRELDNIRTALGWALDGNDVEIGVELAAALCDYWYDRGYWSEGRAWLERALASTGGADATSRAALLHGAGVLCYALGDYDVAAIRLEQGLTLYRDLGDSRGAGAALRYLALIAREQGHLSEAARRLEEALQLARADGDELRVAEWLNDLGTVARRQGNLDQAAERHEAALAVYRAHGDLVRVTNALQGVAGVRWLQGDMPGAVACLEEALPILRALGTRSSLAHALHNLAIVVGDLGERSRRVALCEEALTIFQEVGERAGVADVLALLAVEHLETGDLRRALELSLESLELERVLGRPLPMASNLERLAHIAVMTGDATRAARLLGAARAVLAMTDEIPTGEPAVVRAMKADVERRLGKTAFAVAVEAGQGMTIDEAVAEALALTPEPSCRADD